LTSFGCSRTEWTLCDGQLLPINQNQALFSQLVTTYGADGRARLSLPDLRGRAPIQVGQGQGLGERRGHPSTNAAVVVASATYG
jgi:microcystin-dependent protein